MPQWINRLFHNGAVDKRLDAELQFHLEALIAANMKAGMSPEEARRQAQIALGGLEQVKQETRDVHWENWIENIWRDLRFAVRSLRKDWRLAVTAILTLALGIGASTVVFSIFYNLLFNAFDTHDANRLVIPMREGFRPGDIPQPMGCSLADINAIRQQNHVFDDVVGYTPALRISLIKDGPKSYQLHHASVSGNAFEFYGVPALLGRSILPEDVHTGAEPVFVISYDTWKNEFNSDPQIVGKSFTVSSDDVTDEPRTLIGVMPPRFHAYGAQTGMWIPFIDRPGESEPKYGLMLARLKPGVTIATASAELKVIVEQLEKAHPTKLSNYSEKHFNGRIETATEVLMGPFGLGTFEGLLGNPTGFDLKRMTYSLLTGGLLLLLMACINVANLLLARATVRAREIAVRAALGASRGRMIQQLLLESSVLAVAASGIGCALAYLGVRSATAMIPRGFVAVVGGEVVIGLNRTVLLFALGITALTTLACGLAPAFHATRRNFQPQLSGSGKGVSGNFRHGKLRNALVTGQITISVVLLIGASLLIHSFLQLTHIDLGFNPENVVIASFGALESRHLTEKEDALLRQKILQKLESAPEIANVASYAVIPGYMGGSGQKVTVPGTGHIEDTGVMSGDANLAKTLELRLIRGRWLSNAEVDSAERVAVINQRLAHDFFGDADPVGRELEVKEFTVNSQPGKDTYFQIIGVIADIRNFGITQPALPEAIIPNTILEASNLILKTKTDPTLLMRSIQEQIRAVDGDVVFGNFFTSYKALLNRFTYAAPKLVISAVTPLAVIGLLLVVSGIFSVMAYNVSLQTHDIGIRLALGAQQRDILQMVLKRGLMLIVLGAVIGVGVSLGLTRFIASQLWGVSPTDPWTCVAVVMGILAAGLAACWLPARRATRVDPVITLRYE